MARRSATFCIGWERMRAAVCCGGVREWCRVEILARMGAHVEGLERSVWRRSCLMLSRRVRALDLGEDAMMVVVDVAMPDGGWEVDGCLVSRCGGDQVQHKGARLVFACDATIESE